MSTDCRRVRAWRTLARTPAMLELFSTKFGVPYPYPRYAQVFVADFIFGGMENTSLTTLNFRTLFTAETENLFSSDSLVAHELAHQWFGDLVTCKDWSHVWLNEGFATYYDWMWQGDFSGTPASISASEVPHTVAIEEEPFDSVISETTRIVYGNFSFSGSSGWTARQASLPWPTSRRPGEPMRPASPTE